MARDILILYKESQNVQLKSLCPNYNVLWGDMIDDNLDFVTYLNLIVGGIPTCKLRSYIDNGFRIQQYTGNQP